jgi:hypothetical protein
MNEKQSGLAAAVRDAMIADPDFAVAHVTNLVMRLNLFMGAFGDLAETLGQNTALLSSEDKDKVVAVVKATLEAERFLAEVGNSNLQKAGVYPDGDALADELEQMLRSVDGNKAAVEEDE